MIRSTEAVMASVIMLGTIIYLFNVPSTQSTDTAEQYIRSVLESYSSIGKYLSTSDPYGLKLLIEASMPRGYNQRIAFNYYRRYVALTGIGDTPVEFYLMLPAQGKITLLNSETKSNWYRSVFKITNTGNEPISGATSISANLFKQDIDDNGVSDPIDLGSIMVFTDEGRLNSTLTRYDDYDNKMVVGLSVDIDLAPQETENLYVYYLLGDDYE